VHPFANSIFAFRKFDKESLGLFIVKYIIPVFAVAKAFKMLVIIFVVGILSYYVCMLLKFIKSKLFT